MTRFKALLRHSEAEIHLFLKQAHFFQIQIRVGVFGSSQARFHPYAGWPKKASNQKPFKEFRGSFLGYFWNYNILCFYTCTFVFFQKIN